MANSLRFLHCQVDTANLRVVNNLSVKMLNFQSKSSVFKPAGSAVIVTLYPYIFFLQTILRRGPCLTMTLKRFKILKLLKFEQTYIFPTTTST